jgi:hypothetical protein
MHEKKGLPGWGLGKGWTEIDQQRIGKWRIWCWLGGYGVGGGQVFHAEGRG